MNCDEKQKKNTNDNGKDGWVIKNKLRDLRTLEHLKILTNLKIHVKWKKD